VFPHLWAWYVFLSQYTPAARNAWKGVAASKGAEESKGAAAPAAEDEDDFDPFAEDAGAEEEAAKVKATVAA
jgi:hypothetical protein